MSIKLLCGSKTKSTFISLLGIAFLACSCKPSNSVGTLPIQDPSVSNKLREEIGLRLINTNWHFAYREFGIENWVASSGKSTKSIQYDNGGALNWEEDTYLSGAAFILPSGKSGAERLSIIYYYKEKRAEVAYSGAASNILAALNGYIFTGPKEQVFEKADSVLALWGMSRL